MKRPRLAIVLLLLTAMVSLFGWRFAGDMSVRKADGFTREACRLFSAWRNASPPPSAGIAAEEAAARLSTLVGRPVRLPQGADFLFYPATAEKTDGRQTAAVRFLLGPEPFLLLVAPGNRGLGGSGGAASSLFPGVSFLSGERAGISFVLWKRDGLSCCLASDRELTRVFEIVRRHFP